MIDPGAAHCGHDCCEYPTMPYHSHFLDPDDCPNCQAVREDERKGHHEL